MNRPRLRLLIWACCLVAGQVAARPASAQVDAQTAAVRAAAAAYIEALGRGDAAAIAEFWTADGVYVDAAGTTVQVRQLPSDQLAGGIAPQSEAAPKLLESAIRFVAPNVAVEHGRGDAAAGDGSPSSPAVHFVAVWVKQDDRWRLGLLREFATVPAAAPKSTANLLAELDWMAGRWTATNGGAEIELTAEWTPNKAFLIQRFAAQGGGRAERSGEQRIAWDAVAGQLRSWTFNADGSHSEARWRQEGDVWVATVVGALADGRPVKSTHFWLPEGDDVCWFKSLEGEVDGQPADDLVLKFTRQPVKSSK